jgi:hypothetical protein
MVKSNFYRRFGLNWYNAEMKFRSEVAMKKLTSLLLVVILSLTLANQPVHAWNAHAHRVIASIAFLRLDPDRRLEIANRIRKHPRWEQDFAAKMPEVVKNGDEQIQAEWIFQQAAVWPDTTRNFKGEDRKKYDHPTWHYINFVTYLNNEDKEAIGPIDLNLSTDPQKEQTENMNVIQAINFAKLRIDGTIKVSAEEEALMWCWFFHCYADLHQPSMNSRKLDCKLAALDSNLEPNDDAKTSDHWIVELILTK